MQVTSRNIGFDNIGLLLVVISSILLGIWVTVNTIALRNILLVLGVALGILYWLAFFKSAIHQKIDENFSPTQFAPLALIGLFFCWILFHYFFLSHEPILQLNELKSTWLRSFMAVIVGSATGLAISRNRAYAPILWFGLLLSFIVLLYQYIPKAISNQSMFAIDFFGNYIYQAKFNGVLAGVIMISGLLGMWIDCTFLKLGSVADSCSQNKSKKLGGILISIYAAFGICLALFAFVFIFDAKTGVGLTVILFVLWFFIGFFYFMKRILVAKIEGVHSKLFFRLVIIFLASVLVLGWFIQKHIKNNPGWESLYSDIYISAQVDKYSNWQNTPQFGAPQRDDGQVVRGNTYERVSWAVAGAHLLIDNPLGYGLSRSFPIQMKQIVPAFGGSPYTHSAWIDLGLTFGLPGLTLIIASILIVLWSVICSTNCPWRATVFTFSLSVLILYAVGEYGFQHGVEILFFICGLLCGLTMRINFIPGCSKVDS